MATKFLMKKRVMAWTMIVMGKQTRGIRAVASHVPSPVERGRAPSAVRNVVSKVISFVDKVETHSRNAATAWIMIATVKLMRAIRTEENPAIPDSLVCAQMASNPAALVSRICEAAASPTNELCDGLDNDCDDRVDEDDFEGLPLCNRSAGCMWSGHPLCDDGQLSTASIGRDMQPIR